MREDLNEEFGYWAEVTPGATSSFEVYMNGDLIFSKLQLGRFPNDREIIRLINGI